MSGMRRRFAPGMLAVVLTLGATGMLLPARASDVSEGKHVFRSQCSICHSDKRGQNKIGPSLFGVVGRKTGSEPGYNYSVANKNANITWTPEELNEYIDNPQKIVPGTKMPYGGLKNATKRHDLIEFLETLK